MSKSILITISLIFTLSSSCVCNKNNYRHKLYSYCTSTSNDFFDSYYIYVPIAVGDKVSAGEVLDAKHVDDVIVCLGYQLYDALYKQKYTEENFSNYLLSLYVRNKRLVLSEQQYKIIEEYIISSEDAKKIQQLKRKELYKDNTTAPFLPYILPRNPTYTERCIIYGFLSRAVNVFIEDESGYLRVNG